MPVSGKPTDDAVRAWMERNGGERSATKCSRELGLPRTTVNDAMERLARVTRPALGGRVDLPVFHKGEEAVDPWRVIEGLAESQERKEARLADEDWFPIKFNMPGPIAVVFWGDPHLDSSATDHRTLLEHVNEVRKRDAAFSVCLGDVHDNWVGRLSSEYAKSSVSLPTTKRLIEWFFENINLVLAIRGNHDRWTGAYGIDRWLAEQAGAPCTEWAARFNLVFQNGRESAVVAAHDFKGHSKYHPLHGGIDRARNSGWGPDIHVSGHTHNTAMYEQEGKWVLKAAGYKHLGDDYSRTLGHFGDRLTAGHSIVAVYDPEASDRAGFLQCFSSVSHGLRILDLMRADWEARKGK